MKHKLATGTIFVMSICLQIFSSSYFSNVRKAVLHGVSAVSLPFAHQRAFPFLEHKKDMTKKNKVHDEPNVAAAQ